uniref:Atypical kinase COQ8B, mitochondrial-like n=1 Tax=Cyanistes caeruleus TaxID=156563 RepID=A0A8C0VEW6_CYACU
MGNGGTGRVWRDWDGWEGLWVRVRLLWGALEFPVWGPSLGVPFGVPQVWLCNWGWGLWPRPPGHGCVGRSGRGVSGTPETPVPRGEPPNPPNLPHISLKSPQHPPDLFGGLQTPFFGVLPPHFPPPDPFLGSHFPQNPFWGLLPFFGVPSPHFGVPIPNVGSPSPIFGLSIPNFGPSSGPHSHFGSPSPISGSPQFLGSLPQFHVPLPNFPAAPSPLLSEASAERLVAALSRARGAALKLGQLLSMADPALLTPQLQRILERLRHHAEPMPGWQSFAVLDEELGPGWRDQLQEFQEFPVAAASLGQVHRARLRSGADVAIKIQYPGVALSIGSDIENLLTLLSLSPGLPKGLFPAHSLRTLQRELELECDYEREAASAARFRSLLGSDPFFRVPAVVAPLSSRRVLCTEWGRGEALERGQSLPQERRDQICSQLLRLCLLELFQFRFMQTDPNWANFLYDSQSHTVTLLDFGATREFEREFTDHYIEVIRAAAERDEEKILRKSRDLKFLTGFESQALQSLHVQAVLLLGEPFGGPQPWDFGALGGQRTARGVRGLLPQILRDRLGPPPEPSYALHRKLGGVFLACARLGGRVHCRDIFQEVYESYWGPQNPLGDPKIPGGAPGAGTA